MKKLALNLDDLSVDSFDTLANTRERKGTVAAHDSAGTGCDTNDACCWAGTHGGHTCDTTCNQVICGCSQFATDCDATCPGYHAAEQMSCYDTCARHCG